MELTIKDRLYIPVLFPKEGNFRDFNTKQEIRRKIEISESERVQLGLRSNENNGRIEWDAEKETLLHVDFTKQELEFLKTACEKIADQNLPDDMWSTVERLYDAVEV